MDTVEHVIRVYLEPWDDATSVAPHAGYRGDNILLTEKGVIIQVGAEYIGGGPDWQSRDWMQVETECLIPWHRVHTVERK